MELKLHVEMSMTGPLLCLNGNTLQKISTDFYFSFIKEFNECTIDNWVYSGKPSKNDNYYVAIDDNTIDFNFGNNPHGKVLLTYASTAHYDHSFDRWLVIPYLCEVYAWAKIPDSHYTDNGLINQSIYVLKPPMIRRNNEKST